MPGLTPWMRLKDAYSWPSQPPDLPLDLQGWFLDSHALFLEGSLKELDVADPVVVELGTWKGRSADWWLKQGVRLACIDLWDPSVIYPGKDLADVKLVYEHCVRNLWQYQDRCVLLKMSTKDGLQILHDWGIQPDLIYVDAGHEYEDVHGDISACRRLFPWAKLVGDDFHHPPVRRAVEEAAKAEAMTIEVAGRYCWKLVDHGTRHPETYEAEYGCLPVEGKTVFDWGADWGSTARWFLRRGAAKVIASELRPRDLERLKLYARIEPRIEPMDGIMFGDALSSALDRCDVAKVDVEGAEKLLLEIGSGSIARISRWVMETHSTDLDRRLRERFESLGFSWRVVREWKSNHEVRVVEARRD